MRTVVILTGVFILFLGALVARHVLLEKIFYYTQEILMERWDLFPEEDDFASDALPRSGDVAPQGEGLGPKEGRERAFAGSVRGDEPVDSSEVREQESRGTHEISAAERLRSNISFEDQRRILRLVAKNLKSEDIKYLVKLLGAGLSPEEKRIAVDLALEKFDAEEIAELRELFHRYKKYAY